MADRLDRAKARILIAEDELIIAANVQRKLRSLGYAVPAILVSAKEAVQSAGELRPDLVLMDILFQGETDGIEAAEQIRAQFDIPVVYMTAYPEQAVSERAKLPEPFGCVSKPFDVSELRVAVEMALYKHKIDEQLKESEARCRAVSELTSDYVYAFRVEPEGTPVLEWVTEAFSRITGFTPDEADARGGWSSLIHPDDLPVATRRAQALFSGQSNVSEFRIVTKSGEVCWLRDHGHPIWDEAQCRVVRIYGAAQDITEQKRAEQALQHQLRMEDLVATSSARFIDCPSGEADAEICHTLQALGEFVGADRCYVQVFSSAGTALGRVYEWCAEGIAPRAKEIQGVQLVPFQWVMGKLGRSETVDVPRVANLPPEASAEKEYWQARGIRSVLTIPLIAEGSLIGVLGFSTIHAEKTWAEEDIRLLGIVGEIFVNALARKRAEDTLRDNERLYRALFEEALNPILVADESGRYIDANSAALKFLECDRDELIGKTVWHFAPPDLLERHKREHSPFVGRRTLETEYLVQGTNKALLLNVVPVDVSGRTVLFGIGQDVTGQKQMEDALQRRLQEQTLLGQVTTLIASAEDTIEALQNVCAKLACFLRVAQAGFAILNPQRTVARVIADYHPPDSPSAIGAVIPVAGNPSMVHILEHKAPLAIADAQTDPLLAPVHDIMRQRNVRSILIVPVIATGEVIGTLGFDAFERRVFSDPEIDIVQRVAAQMGQVLIRRQAEDAVRQRTAQLEALRQVGLGIAAQLDLDALLHSIVSHSVELLKGNAGGLYLYWPERDVLEMAAAVGPGQEPIAAILRRGEGLSGRVLETGEPLIVDDYQHWEGRAAALDGRPFGAVVGVPIRWGPVGAEEGCLGVLNVLADTPGVFSPADTELLSLFAAQTAIAIRNARLYETEQKRATQLAVVNQVAAQITSILDPDQLLQEIAAAIQQGFGYHNVALFLLDETARELSMMAIAGSFEGLIPPDYRQAVGVGMIGWVAETGQSLLANDVRQEPRHLTSPARKAGAQSELSVPIKLADRVVGVLDVQDIQLYAFDETDRVAMEILADQIAVAIENARLYERSRRDAEARAVLLRELHHRVKNNLTVVSSLLDLQAGAIEDERALEAFRESGNRVRSMARIHEQLYRSHDLARVDMARYLQELGEHLLTSYGGYDVSLKVEATNVILVLDMAIPLGLIVNELVSNALKYAFPDDRDRESKAGDEIWVQMQVQGGECALVVSDNGIGLPADLDLENTTSLGLTLVHLLTSQLGGTLKMDGRAGTTFEITFPAPTVS